MNPFQKPVIVIISLIILKKGMKTILISFEYLKTFSVYFRDINKINKRDIMFI